MSSYSMTVYKKELASIGWVLHSDNAILPHNSECNATIIVHKITYDKQQCINAFIIRWVVLNFNAMSISKKSHRLSAMQH